MASDMPLGELAVRVRQFERRVDQGITRGLRDASGQLLAQVQGMFGYYQNGAGPFPTWAKLAGSTIDRKKYSDAAPVWGELPAAPLVRTGDLAMSYNLDVEGHEAVVGSDSDYALIHETGGYVANRYIPQRSTLGLAFVRYERKLFGRFNASAWYTVIDPSGIQGVIHDDDPYDRYEDMEDITTISDDEEV